MNMRRVAVATSIGALLLVLLAPNSLGDTSRFKAAGCTDGPRWDPSGRTISKGDRIVWSNPTSCEHTVNAYSGRWSKATGLPSGSTTAKTFKRTGTYKFRCFTQGHSVLENGVCNGMCGKVRVVN